MSMTKHIDNQTNALHSTFAIWFPFPVPESLPCTAIVPIVPSSPNREELI